MEHLSSKNLLVCFLLSAALARAQYTPPPASTPGALDSLLQSAAATGWDIGLNARGRREDKDGAGTTHAGSNFDFFSAPPSANSNAYWLTRVMPWVGYTGGWFAVMAEGRSSYSLDDDRYTPAAAGSNLPEDDGPLQLEKAYVALGDLKRFPLVLTVGRQELSYGDQRLIGPSLWLNVPHTFDAAKLQYQGRLLAADLFASHPVYTEQGHFDRSVPQDTLSGLDVAFPHLSAGSTQDVYVFSRDVTRAIVGDNWSLVPAPFRFTAPQDLYTLGYRAKSKPTAHGPWDYGIEAMWQLGNRTAVFPATTVAAAERAPRLRQDAWAFVAQGGFTVTAAPWRPRAALIVSCASGDRNAADGSSETFQNLLPTNHDLYGLMDLSSLQNLVDYRLNIAVKPTASTRLALDAHQQYLETTHDYWYNVAGVPRNTSGAAPGSGDGFGINPGYSPDLGQEVDLLGGWSVCKALLLEMGASRFFRGPYVKESLRAVGSKDADYWYAQATLTL